MQFQTRQENQSMSGNDLFIDFSYENFFLLEMSLSDGVAIQWFWLL